MKLTYDELKMLGQVILPAIITCVITILAELNVECVESVSVILGALLTCYNAVIVWWNKEYYKNQTESAEVNE